MTAIVASLFRRSFYTNISSIVHMRSARKHACQQGRNWGMITSGPLTNRRAGSEVARTIPKGEHS
jgi:hypothetical protein